jgi:hypothetical protein
MSFLLPDFTGVYGGFHGDPGGETLLAQRDPVANVTVLSGDLLGDDGPNFSNRDENSFHVVTAPDVGESSVLDGFTISGGYANSGVTPDLAGGGILISSTIGVSRPIVARCRLTSNWAIDGGGVFLYGPFTDSTFVNCSFIANFALTGGGVHWKGTDAQGTKLVNCQFATNTAANKGGAIAPGEGGEIMNCTFVDNSAQSGKAIHAKNPGTVVTNSIFWGAPDQISSDLGISVTVSYSDIQGGYPGTGNVNADPRFVNQSAGDYRLSKPCSPCVDAGHSADGDPLHSSCTVPAGYLVPCALSCPGAGSGIPCDNPWDVDQDGTTGEPTPDLRFPTIASPAPRILDGEGDDIDDPRIDMGAYEFVRACCPWDCQTNVYPTDGVVGAEDGTSLRDQYGQQCTSCDFGVGPDGVDDTDWFALVQHWGPCNEDCSAAQEAQAGMGGPQPTLTLEEALWIIGYEGVDDYIAWGQEATETEVAASRDLLLALFGY